ncbi:MAG: cytochrome P460 family protein [Nitrospiraceae bacterium]
MTQLWGLLLCAVMVWGCAEMGSAQPASVPAKLRDGEPTLPVGYQKGPRFLSDVQRPDLKQVRELFINAVGLTTKAGQPFPNGTVMVMELYKTQVDGDTPVTGPDGKLVKGDLAKIFVMEKGEGWGQEVPENLKTGNWVFAAYGPDGKALTEDFSKCRGCHAPLAMKDFVPRYDEYFEKRAAR